MIQYDVETTGLQWPYHRAFLYQFGDDTGAVEVLHPKTDRERIQHWFTRGKDEGIMAWNTKFDWHFAANDGYDLPDDDKWFDGMVIAHAINENRSVALKSIANEVLGIGADDLQKSVKQWLTDERRRRAKEAKAAKLELIEPNYSDVPDDLMRDYAAEDIHLTRRVIKQFQPILERSEGIRKIIDFEHEVLGALWHMERRGFPVDEEGYRLLEHEVVENLEALEDRCAELASVGIDPVHVESGGWTFNPRSSKQILEALKRRGADISFVTNDSMDAENLGTVDDELARTILEFRSEAKAHSTYIVPYISRTYEASIRSWKEQFIAPDGRIHANFRQVGTKTGRMSCSDPNLQNQPRDDLRLRYNFRAEPGHVLVACDLSNVEMRIFAAYAGEGLLLSTIREGGDLHALTAEFIGIHDRVRAGGHVESARQRAKVVNFSIVYGGGVRTIRKQQGVNQDEARRMLRRYHDAYPEVKRLQNKIEWALQDRGYIQSAWGRRFRMSPDDAYKGVNYLVQGTAADLLKAALIRLHKQGVPVVACVHDEIVAHVPEEDAERVKGLIEEAMIDHPQITDKVPLVAEGEIIHRWSEAKDPDFKPKWASS